MQNSPNITKVDALRIEHVLPEAVVLEPMAPTFTQQFNDSGAVWMCAELSLLIEGDEPETSPDWQARCGGAIAVPAKPNTGNSKRAMQAGISGLDFQRRMNCGYCISEALFRDGPFSVAVLYAPATEHDPCSLVTVNPMNFDNYVFLTDRDGAVELTDQQASFALKHPITQDARIFRLVVFSRTEEGYTLAVDGEKTIFGRSVADSLKEDGPLLDTSGLCDLFIGCRSHRSGILKTLGQMLLTDVFLWPDKDILAVEQGASDDQNSPEYDLLLKYYTEVICRDI